MLLNADRSLVLVVDMQARLAPSIERFEQVEASAAWVLEVATELAVPVWATEQYPRGLGSTVDRLARLIPAGHVLEKNHFGALEEPGIADRLQALGRRQIVVLGTEAHVCVLQTAIGLLESGYETFVVAEAVGSRSPDNKQLALSRMSRAGVQVVSREMLAFEWLERAGTDIFRRISRRWIR
jgi:nicotinamidase-related amidase